MPDSDAAKTAWSNQLYDTLRDGGVTTFAYVPDSGVRVLIDRSIADADALSVPLTTEGEGVSLLAGMHLGGGRGVLMMQSSGVGNCVNMFSLLDNGRFPFLGLVSMRGDFGEQNPWQIPMGQGAEPVMEAMGVKCLRVETPGQVVPTAHAAMGMAFKSSLAVAIILTQRLVGAKPF